MQEESECKLQDGQKIKKDVDKAQDHHLLQVEKNLY
jgi:hypothetical protein